MAAPNGKALFNPFMDQASWDLSQLSYHQWLDFIFQHPAAHDDWYWEDKWEYKVSDNHVILQYLIDLASSPHILAERYSDEQLETGFWFVLGPAGFIDVVWDESIARGKRIDFIRLNTNIFRQLFATHPLGTIVFMWWDLLENGMPPSNADEEALQEAMLWALGDILGMEESHCFRSALHGLNHLEHPRTPEFIDYFLATKPWLDDEIRQYASECRTGQAM